MKQFFVFLILTTIGILGCNRSEKSASVPRKAQCICPIEESHIKLSGEYTSISSNSDESEIKDGDDFEISFSSDSTGKSASLKLPKSMLGEKNFRYEKLYFDGREKELQEKVFYDRWCELWMLYRSAETCQIPDSIRREYKVEVDTLFLKFGIIKGESRDITKNQTQKIPKKSTSGVSKSIEKRKECRDTIIRPSYYSWEKFSYVKHNNIAVQELNNNRYSFCFRVGDTLEIKSSTGEVLSFIFK